MSLESNTAFLSVGGAAAGASLASAAAGLVLSSTPLAIPIGGGILALVALKLIGVLDSPDRVIVSSDVSEKEKEVPNEISGSG